MTTSEKPALVRSAFSVLVSLPAAGFGLLLLYILGSAAIEDIRTYSWSELPCTIVESSATTQPRGVREFSATYTYELGDRVYRSSQVTGSRPYRSSDQADIDRLLAAYPPGRTTKCYASAANPGQSVLQRPGILIYLILIPALGLIAIPVALLIRLVREQMRPAAEGAPAAGSGGFAFFKLLAWALMLVGAAITYVLFIAPALQIHRAQAWRATPCTIVASALRTVRNTGSATSAHAYWIDIEYEYVIDAKPFRGNRYDFWGADGSNVDHKQRIVDAHRPRTTTTCFVDTADPTQAVLDRTFDPWRLTRLLPLVFSAVGLSIWLAIRKMQAD